MLIDEDDDNTPVSQQLTQKSKKGKEAVRNDKEEMSQGESSGDEGSSGGEGSDYGNKEFNEEVSKRRVERPCFFPFLSLPLSNPQHNKLYRAGFKYISSLLRHARTSLTVANPDATNTGVTFISACFLSRSVLVTFVTIE